MAKHFQFAKLFLLAMLLANICEKYAAFYQPPAATVQPLHPKGLRISVPDEHGITLVAFHITINEEFDGLESGHIAKDLLRVRNGRWTYEDRHTQLKRDDIIYYWVHFVREGLGYNLVDQSHRVIDFYNYDGTLYIGNTVKSSQSCTTTSSTFSDNVKMDCTSTKRKLIIEDENEKKEEGNADAANTYNQSIPCTLHSTPSKKRATSNIKNIQNICDEKELRLVKIREAIEQQRELHAKRITIAKAEEKIVLLKLLKAEKELEQIS